MSSIGNPLSLYVLRPFLLPPGVGLTGNPFISMVSEPKKMINTIHLSLENSKIENSFEILIFRDF